MIKNNRGGKRLGAGRPTGSTTKQYDNLPINSELIKAVNKKGYTEQVEIKKTDINTFEGEKVLLYKTKTGNHYCYIEKLNLVNTYILRVFDVENKNELEIPFLHYSRHYEGTIEQLKKELITIARIRDKKLKSVN
jgi:hypothetical protein